MLLLCLIRLCVVSQIQLSLYLIGDPVEPIDMIRILLVDDQALLREVLQNWLEVERDFEIVGQAENGKQAIEQVKKYLPDIVLMDLEMPEMDGFEATKTIVAEFPEVKVIILTGNDNLDYQVEALEVGAKRYLPKNTTAMELTKTIRSVYQEDRQLLNQKTEQWDSEAIQKLVQEIELRWGDLQDEIVSMQEKLQSSLEDIECSQQEFHLYINELKNFKVGVENILNQLNMAGVNPANLQRWEKLQNQLNSYKIYVQKLHKNLEVANKRSRLAVWGAMGALVISLISIIVRWFA